MRVRQGSMTEIIRKSELNRRQSYTADRDDHISAERDYVELTYEDGRATVVALESSADHFDFMDFVSNEPMTPKAACDSAKDAAERLRINLVVIPDGLDLE